MGKIPKIIHYVWLGGGEKPQSFVEFLKGWKALCPDYEIREWNESNVEFSESPYAAQAYAHKKYGFASDYIRAKALYEFGGIYLDTDVGMEQSFDALLDNDFFISFENNIYLETAIIGCIPKHPLVKKVRDLYLTHPFQKKNGKLDLTPNPPIWTWFLREQYGLKLNNKTQTLTDVTGENEQTVTVYSKDYFSPLNYTTKKLKKTENTHTVHYFSATWFSDGMKVGEKALRAVYYAFTPKAFDLFTLLWVKSIFKRLKKENKTYGYLDLKAIKGAKKQKKRENGKN